MLSVRRPASAGDGNGDGRPAVREFVSRISEERKDKLGWRRLAFILMCGYPILFALLVYFSTLPRVTPFLIEHDTTTDTYSPIGPAKPGDPPGIRAREAFIGHWLEDLYTVTDDKSQVNVRKRVFGMVKASSQAYRAVNDYWTDTQRGPSALRTNRLTYAVTVENVDATDNEHFVADYQLRVFDTTTNELRYTDQRHAQITVEYHPEVNDDQLLWVNPTDLYITQFIDTSAGNAAPAGAPQQQ